MTDNPNRVTFTFHSPFTSPNLKHEMKKLIREVLSEMGLSRFVNVTEEMYNHPKFKEIYPELQSYDVGNRISAIQQDPDKYFDFIKQEKNNG